MKAVSGASTPTYLASGCPLPAISNEVKRNDGLARARGKAPVDVYI
jgi:hypothetical protein